ncbi:ketopantoate reductase family protein [Maritimibacter sp. 55A14]|uniref:ketopantoate reductase family protein n=1 Tax=Maritimibacter sp. 55A14 TaxID=2174844 RepID=UPI001E63E345|nr:2-dehydropantoate 2-reductase [Maritimibacter sp. 55A14]
MRIAVMGAGAVGCYYGAMLALAGHEVVLVGRAAFVDAVSRDGLILEKDGKRLVAQVEASSDPSAIAGAGMVMICVKSGDTEEAGRQIAPYLDPTARVLSLQNGVSNAEMLNGILGRPVLPVVVYVASRMNGPDIVRHEGRGDLELSGQGAEDVAGILNAAGVETRVSEDVMSSLWAKLVVNCAINPLSAITGLPYGKMAAQEGVPQLMEDIAREALSVAQAEGISVSDAVFETIRTIPVSMAGQVSSTAQDLVRGKPTEIDFLNGEIVERATKLGIDVPINRTLTLLVKCAERGNANDRKT